MNKAELEGYLAIIDRKLAGAATLFIYGSAAGMLQGEETRMSLDIDVAAPYSNCDITDLRNAAMAAGLPVNPEETYQGDHIEWISGIRLCLAPPDSSTDVDLWRGKSLTIRTGSSADLIASKLIRYDEFDQSDIHFLYFHSRPSWSQIELAADRLPGAFKHDPVLLDNLRNLKIDIQRWEHAL